MEKTLLEIFKQGFIKQVFGKVIVNS